MKKNYTKKLFCLLFLSSIFNLQPISALVTPNYVASIKKEVVVAVAPVNDDCANATVLTVGATCVTALGDVTNATESAGIMPGSCITDPSPKIFDVWYKFTATMTTITVEVKGTQEFDPVVEVYGACPTSTVNTAIACADNNIFKGGTEKITLTNLIVNNTYYVRVYNWADQLPQTSLFYICAYTSQASAPNDECTDAISITPGANYLNCNSITVNTTGATQSIQSTTCASASTDDDVWYKFVANSNSMVVKVSNIQSGILGIGMALYDGCNGTQSAECEAAAPDDSLEFKNLTNGNTYYLRVYTYGASDKGTFDMCVYKSLSATVSNDACSGAINITAGTSCNPVSGDVVNATESSSPISCTTFTSDKAYDVWYKFTATSTDQLIDVTGSSNFDAVVVLYSACSGTILSCADVNGEGETETINATGLTPGTVYFVRVYHYGTLPLTTTFDICVYSQLPITPSNDDCSNPVVLTVGSTCSPVTGDLSGATQSLAPEFCNGTAATAKDVWFVFAATATSQTIDVTSSSGLDAVVVMYDACNGTALGCSDNGGGIGTSEHINATGLTIGNTYVLRVYAYNSNPTTTTFGICVYNTPGGPPANDLCASATVLTVGSSCLPVTGDVSGATQSTAPISCNGTATTAKDVWYKFTATASNQLIDVTSSSNFDAVVVLYDVCFGTILDCSDSGGGVGTSEHINATGLTVGNTYIVRIYAYNSNPATTTFDICVHGPSGPPANDACANATVLTVGSGCSPVIGDVSGATQSTAPISCNGTAAAAKDVWYTFTATASNQTIDVTSSSGLDAVVVLYDVCFGTVLDCSDNGGGVGTSEHINATGLTIGNIYIVRVYAYNSNPATTTFDICVYTTIALSNDECAGAINISVASDINNCSPITVNTTGATQSSNPITCATISQDDDVWYKFTALDSNMVVKGSNLGGGVIGIGMALYDGCNGNQSAECEVTAPGDSLLFQDLIIGNVYYLRIFTSGNSSSGQFDICVYKTSPGSAPLNDDCSGAISLVSGNACVPVNGSVSFATESMPAYYCNSFTSPNAYDVWYSFTASSKHQVIEVTGDGDFDPVVGLYTSCSGSLMNCADYTYQGETEVLKDSLTIGSVYYVRVYHYGSSLPSNRNFSICVYKDNSVTSVNTIAANRQINLYPNPTTGILNISLENLNQLDNTSLKLIGVSGQLIIDEQINSNGLYLKQVDLSEYPGGIYYLLLTNNSGTVVKKVILAK